MFVTRTAPRAAPRATLGKNIEACVCVRGMRARSLLSACVVGAIVVAIVYVIVQRLALGRLSHIRSRTTELSNAAAAYAIGAMVWPLVWFPLVGAVMLRAAPLTVLGLLWPPIMLSLDLLWVTRQPLEPEVRTTFAFDGNSISSLSFALGGILLSQVGKTFSKSAAPLLSGCIFLVIAFVLPSPSVHGRSGAGSVVLSVRKVALTFCVGLLISAVAISLQMGMLRRGGITATHLRNDDPPGLLGPTLPTEAPRATPKVV